MELFCILTVMVVTCNYTCAKIHRTVHPKSQFYCMTLKKIKVLKFLVQFLLPYCQKGLLSLILHQQCLLYTCCGSEHILGSQTHRSGFRKCVFIFFKKSKGILDVFVYYCCITNYHKLSGLIQHPFMNSHFCRLEGWHSMNGLSAEGIIKLKSNVDWTEFSSG